MKPLSDTNVLHSYVQRHSRPGWPKHFLTKTNWTMLHSTHKIHPFWCFDLSVTGDNAPLVDSTNWKRHQERQAAGFAAVARLRWAGLDLRRGTIGPAWKYSQIQAAGIAWYCAMETWLNNQSQTHYSQRIDASSATLQPTKIAPKSISWVNCVPGLEIKANLRKSEAPQSNSHPFSLCCVNKVKARIVPLFCFAHTLCEQGSCDVKFRPNLVFI